MIAKKDYKSQLKSVKNRISEACQTANRAQDSVQLIGASKTKPASMVRDFFNLGQTHFGENYLNEALTKQQELHDLDITWHYIGQIQSNKTKLIANHFDWVHGVDRYRVADRLNTQKDTKKPLNILIQINVDEEDSKAGIGLNDAIDLTKMIAQLPNITLRGYMALPKAREDFIAQKNCLIQLSEALDAANQSLGLQMDTISAGMSNDLEAAVAAGTTMVRIGTDLFGART